MPEIVYILTNPCMSDLIKIGRTTNLEDRMRNLSSHSGVPVAFDCYYACEVKDSQDTEKRLHVGLGDHRINPRREFFEFNAERAKILLEGYAIQEVTPADNIVESPEEKKALDKARSKKSPPLRFSQVGVEVGSELTFIRDPEKIAIVSSDRKVKFEGKESYLNRITLDLLKKLGKDWPSVRGSDYWMYGDKTLTEIRQEIEDQEEEED